MRIKQISLFIAAAIASATMSAQSQLPKTVIAGHEFYYYEAGRGESVYDIAAKLGVTKDYIINNNPQAADGIEQGMTLYFPTDKTDKAPVATSTQAPVQQIHIVEQGQTLYGLAKRYGVGVDDFIAANPGSENGIKTGQKLIVPQGSRQATAAQASQQVRDAFGHNGTAQTSTNAKPVYHTLQAGESIYSIAKQYNANIEDIFTANPGLEPAGYTTGATIRITPNTARPFTYERTSVRNYKHEVQRGETFASIAAANGITEKDIIAANPGQKRAKKGKTITVPKPYTQQANGEMATISIDELRDYYDPRLEGLYDELVGKRLENEVNIALILPFQLHKSAPPKQAYLYTDFYKGFLLALDSAQRVSDKHINLKVFDTQHNLNVTDSILALPELRSMNMIIAPSEPQQLAKINAFGLNSGIPVMNCFTTKNEDYLDNPFVYQVNTPTDEMMADVMQWFDKRFSGYSVIFLAAPSENDKEMFEFMRKHISTGKKFETTTINVNSELTYNNISNQMNPGSKYVFIPSSGDKALIKRYIKALKEVKKERFDCDLSLIAYPEYVLYLKEYQTDFQDLDTHMFTRFFNAKGFKTRDFEAAYKANFSGEPLQAIPNMAIYGFDTGMYLLKTLGTSGRIDEHTPMYRGIQTSFRWERGESWRGMTNQAIEIVHFSTDHQITVNVP